MRSNAGGVTGFAMDAYRGDAYGEDHDYDFDGDSEDRYAASELGLPRCRDEREAGSGKKSKKKKG